MATVSLMTVAGVGSATGQVAWAGSASRRKQVFWLPTPTTPITLDGKTLNPVWYRAFHEIFENRLGGVEASTIPQVTTEQADTRVQVLKAYKQAVQAQASANSAGQAVNVAAQVSVNSALPGATQIPKYNSSGYLV